MKEKGNYLKNAELDTEQNYNMIEDGERIQDVDTSYDLIGILPYSLLKNLQNEETV